MAYMMFYVEDVPFNDVWDKFKKLSFNKKIDLINQYAYKYERLYCRVIWQPKEDEERYCLDSSFFRHELYLNPYKSDMTKIFKKLIKVKLSNRIFYKMILKALAK